MWRMARIRTRYRLPRCSAVVPLLVALAAWGAPAHGQSACAPATSGLDSSARARLDADGTLLVTERVPDSPWPRVIVYRFIDATPEEAVAVFADYARHASYMPNLAYSRVHVIDDTTADVDYQLRVPLLPDERYTVRDRLRRYTVPGMQAESATSYQVTWSLVRASSTRAADGDARFEPCASRRLARRGTLLIHRNLVVPGFRLASLGFIRARAIAQARATADAIAAEVERERNQDAALLGREVAALRAALAP